MDLALTIGPDVAVCPCETIVPLYRKHVFARIKPSTRTRIDLGLALKDLPPSGRLISTGGLAKGDRITLRIAVTAVEQVDEDVESWLRKSYELDS